MLVERRVGFVRSFLDSRFPAADGALAFYWHSGHVTACGVLRCAPAERAEEEWSLDAVVSLCCWRSLLAPISTANFAQASFDKQVAGYLVEEWSFPSASCAACFSAY